jgi:hypothetical protein
MREKILWYICEKIGHEDFSLCDKLESFFSAPSEYVGFLRDVEIKFNVTLPTYKIEMVIDLIDMVSEGML